MQTNAKKLEINIGDESMNKKGFTLVELLAIIVLLGLVALLSFNAIDKYIKQSRDKMYETQVNNIILSAKNWGVDHPLLLPQYEGDTKEITLGFLMDEGYVDLEIENPKTRKQFSKHIVILITKKEEIYEYEFLG